MNKKEGSKVLLVTSYTLPYHSGGGLNAFNFGRYLVSKGIRAKILTFNRNLKLPFISIIESLKVVRIPYFNKGYLLKTLSLTIIIPWYIIEIVRNNIIIIYGGYIIGWELIPIIGRIAGKRVIFRSTMYNEDDIESLLSKHKVLTFIRKRSLKKITFYLALTPAFSFSYKKYFTSDNKIIETPQGVNTEIFYPVDSHQKNLLRRKLGIPIDVFIICTVGSLIIRKGYLKIYQELIKLNFPFLYIVLGDYDLSSENLPANIVEKAKIIKATGDNLLRDRIQFKGFVQNIDEYLKISDVYVTASNKEGLSNSLLESMSCGLPVILKELNGLQDYLIIHKKNGLFYNNENSLSDAINTVYNDRELRINMGYNAANTIRSAYSYQHVIEKLSIVQH